MNSIFMMVCFNGIFMRNVDNVNINPSSTSDIFENEINFGVVSNNTTTNFYGIRLENSAGFSITTNTIDKQNGNNPSSAVIDKLRGISLLNSANNIVASNSITRLGTGIRAFGSCTNATLTCNVLFRNFHGFKFEGPADIGNQLPGAIPTGNIWTTLPGAASDIDINLNNPIDWYYATNGYNPDWIGNAASFNNGTGPTSASNSDICSQFSLLSPIDERENKLGAIVRNEKIFSNFTQEFTLSDKVFAYTKIKNDSTLLNLGTNDDSLYQNFYTQCSGICVGQFENVKDFILNNNLQNALNINNSINDNINWESNQKTFNEIYIRFLNGDTIAYNDSLILENIAYSNAIDGGNGVFAARAFLNLDIEDTPSGTLRSQLFEEEITEETTQSFDIFPNPSTGIVQISLEDESLNYSALVKDITGKIIINEKGIIGNHKLDLSGLKEGIYFIELITSFKKIQLEKLVLIK